MNLFIQTILYSTPALIFACATAYYYRMELAKKYVDYKVHQEEEAEKVRQDDCTNHGNYISYTHPRRSRYQKYIIIGETAEETVREYMEKDTLLLPKPMEIMSIMVTYNNNTEHETKDEIDVLSSLYGPEGDWHYNLMGPEYVKELNNMTFSFLFPGCVDVVITEMTDNGDINMFEKKPSDNLYFVKL